MSDREMCVKLLNIVPEYKLGYLLSFLQGLTADEIPNADTIAALNETADMKMHPEQYKRYTSFDELLYEVLGDA